ncbi:MAG: gamma-glutamyltransferase [Devosia sp.]
MIQTWEIRKGQVESDKGLVAAQHFEAARAGARVLGQGGNAIDAAVVTALVLSVVEPWLSGVGGGGFLLYGNAATGQVETLDFNVRAPRKLDPANYPLVGGRDVDWFEWPAVEGDRNIIGYSSICVPGAVAGLAAALEKHGTITWREALAPAIAVAERGMELDWFSALCFAIDADGLSRFETSAALFLREGTPAKVLASGGPRYLPMPAKAAMLKNLAERGARDFYEGEIASRIAADLKAGGSAIDQDDLAGYQPRWGRPATQNYRDTEINAIAGLSGGPSYIRAMREVETHLVAGTSPDAGAARVYARAIRRSYEDRLKTMGQAGRTGEDCTSHLSVVDRHGNMVSLTNTLLSRFGSKVTLPSLGFLMNNGMMWFDPRHNASNRMAPGAQPLANMCPLLLTKNGKPYLAIGAAGGRQIFPALVQLTSYVVDYGMTLEQAFHEPRIDASTPTICVDRAAPADVAAVISADYPVRLVSNTLHPVNFAIASAVRRDPLTSLNQGMAHPTNPWSDVIEEGCHGARDA